MANYRINKREELSGLTTDNLVDYSEVIVPKSGGTFTGAISSPSFSGDGSNLNEITLNTLVIKSSPGTLLRGQAIYIKGYDVLTDAVTVELANAASTSTMPAFGLLETNVTDSQTGYALQFGQITGITTSAYTEGQAIYVSTTSGGLTNIRPTGATTQIQKIAIVHKIDAVDGHLTLLGAGRTNALPNITNQNFWLGGTNGFVTETTINTLPSSDGFDSADEMMIWDNSLSGHTKLPLSVFDFLTKASADTYYVNVTGDTMTGTLFTPSVSATTISGDTLFGNGNGLIDLNIKFDNEVFVGPTLNDLVKFTSVKAAVDSITDATSNNVYQIKVNAGVYIEDTISMKEYVYINGESSLVTTISIDDNTKDLFLMTGNSSVNNCFLLGGTNTDKSIFKTTTAFGLGASFSTQNCLFGAGDKMFNINVSTGSSIVSIVNCGMSLLGTFKTFIDIQGSGSTTVSMANTKLAWSPFVNADNFLHLRGVNNSVSITDFGLINQGFVTNLFRVNDGSTLNLIGASVDGGNNVIYNENIGAGATIRCANVSIVNATNDIDILHSGTTGFFSGVKDYSKTNIVYESPFYISGEDSRLITVNKKGGNFNTIKEAVDSITDSSDANRYQILVGPGEFIEQEINMVGKPYVSVVGSSIQTTIVKPLTQTQNIFSIGEYNELSFMWLEGAGVGYAGIDINDSGDYSQVHKVTINNCNIGVNIQSSTQHTIFYGEYLDINGEYDYGVKVVANNGFLADVNLENYYNFPESTGSTVCTYVSGFGAKLHVSTCGNTGDGDGNDTAFYVQNAGELNVSNTDVDAFDIGYHVGNVGSGSTISIISSTCGDSSTYDLFIEHPNTSGVIQSIFTNDKISIDPSASISLTNQDPVDSSYSIIGDFKMGNTIDTVTDVTDLVVYGTSYGVYSGGTISANTGLTFNVSVGYGYLEDTITNYVKYVGWSGVTGVVIPTNSVEYVYVNDNGVVSISTSLPVFKSNIFLGRVVSDGTNIVSINNTPLKGKQYNTDIEAYRRDILKTTFKSGSIVSANASPRKLNVSAGIFYFSNNKITPTGGTAISFTPIYNSATPNQWIYSTPTDTVSNTLYDTGTGATGTITAGKWVKHALYVNGSGTSEKYFLQYGDVLYDTQVDAEAGGLPTPPSFFTEGIVSIASFVLSASSTNITVIKDERPFLGAASSGTGGGGTNDHSALINLTNDDHLQYLLVDGTRAMSGNLNLGTNQITSAGNINGVSITAHASRHLPNGADALSTGVPSNIGTTNSTGTANAFARQDHVHAHGDQTSGTLHAIATEAVNGFMSAADKSKIGILYTGGTISGNLRVNSSFANIFSGNTGTAVYYGNGSNLTGIGEVNTVSNVGGGNQLVNAKSGVNIPVKTLIAGTNITITSGATTLTINSSGGGSSKITNSGTTTNATLTLLGTINTIPDNSTSIITVFVKAYQASATQWGVWKRTLSVTKVSGVVTIRETNADVDKQSTGLKANSLSFSSSSGNVLINVTGIAATTINWVSAHEIII